MIFRVLGFEEDIVKESFSSTRRELHELWLNWLKSNPPHAGAEQRFEQLIALFYEHLGFTGDWQGSFHSDSILISRVLQRRSGNATSLAVLLHYFTRKFDLECQLLAFPAQAMLRFVFKGHSVFFDPFRGVKISREQLSLMHRGHVGDLALLDGSHLQKAAGIKLAVRWLDELKVALLREEKFVQALAVSNLLLNLRPGDPHEMRDRGYIYQQLECHSVAINDFEYFIERCPDDPLSKILRMQIHSMDEQPATLH